MDISGQIEIMTKHSSMEVEFQFGEVESKTCKMEIGGFEAKVKGTPFDFLVNFFIEKFEDKLKTKLPGEVFFFF